MKRFRLADGRGPGRCSSNDLGLIDRSMLCVEEDTDMADDVDEWGVPASMFGGAVPDEFAAALARVAMLSALVESKLLGLLSTVGAEPQDVWAGKAAGEILSKLETIAVAGMPARQSAPAALLDALRVEVVAARSDAHARNELLHAVWPVPLVDGGLGWKLLPKKQRDVYAQWSRAVTGDFRPLIGRFVNHVRVIDNLRAQIDQLPRRVSGQ